MFKIKQTPTFFWPVEVLIPTDGGKFDKQTFDAEFKRLDQDQLKALRERIERREVNDDQFVREVLVGWRGVNDGDAELPFSETAVRQVLLVPNAAASIVLAFTEAHAGLIRKN